MGTIARIRTAGTILRDRGLMDLLRYAAHRAVENYYERHFDIDTGHDVMLENLGVHDKDAVMYSPSPYSGFFKAMRLVGADLPSSVFVDYGSGLGRIVICAATLPFRRVIGVELVEELNRRARLNIERARRRLQCKDVSVATTNATQWPVPADASVFHFYNPFLNETLRATIATLARSLQDKPREAWILFGSPWQMSRLLAAGEIIPLSWQKGSSDVRWPFTKDISAKDPNGYRYRVFRIDSRV
jgi:Histone methylation protein DOT1